MTEQTETPSPMDSILAYAIAHDVKNINQLPGCWEVVVDETWWFALNGHSEPVTSSEGAEVPPFSAYVKYNGWPAGIFAATGEGVFAGGEGANVWTFDAAIQSAIGKGVIADQERRMSRDS